MSKLKHNEKNYNLLFWVITLKKQLLSLKQITSPPLKMNLEIEQKTTTFMLYNQYVMTDQVMMIVL